MAIERVRFDDRLDVRFEIPSDVEDELVPSLILQPLVENAIRHGFAATAGVHHLIVRACGDGASLVIEVENDGSGLAKDWSVASARTGLSNAQARVDLANGRHQPIELLRRAGGGSIVRFRLPRAAASAVSAA